MTSARFPAVTFLEKTIAEKGDDGLEAVSGANLEDFLAELGGGTDGLEADGYCEGLVVGLYEDRKEERKKTIIEGEGKRLSCCVQFKYMGANINL